ncbi:hypothetical protein [Crocosphaera sp. Alani8]|uniref:hypothetical protein n=1 Tax=Crocosphaera sp. Alani8 TaxID=3038952 RepID=UPI00313BF0CA
MRKFISLALLSFLSLVVTKQSVLAVSFTVTGIASEEAIFNDPLDTLTPTTLNNVLSFTVDDGVSSRSISTRNFFGLIPDTIDTPFPIQYKGLEEKLFEDDRDYLSAGTNGLSLLTGINKIVNQEQEVFFFPSLVTEGAITNPTDPDWNLLGTQNLERVDNNNGQEILTFDNRQLSGLAIELSDFVGLTPQNARDVTSLRISLPETGNDPRTDYAFISSDVNSVSFENQVLQEVPEPTSLLGLVVTVGLGLFSTKSKSAHLKEHTNQTDGTNQDQ